MEDSLFFIAIIVFGIVALIYSNPALLHQLMHRATNKVTPTWGIKWIVKHPNGEKSIVEYYRKNVNQKTMWKLHGWLHEIHAEFDEDVKAESFAGAFGGKAYFIFRFNRDGTETEWEDPSYRAHFAKMRKLRQETEFERKNELKRLATKEDKFMVGKAEEAKKRYAKYGDSLVERRMAEELLKFSPLRQKPSYLNPREEGVPVAEEKATE